MPKRIYFAGRVEWIGIRPARGEAKETLDSVAVTPGKGLKGKRFRCNRRTFFALQGLS